MGVDEWLNAVQAVFVIGGGLFALGTFRRDASVRRADWLKDLHQRFFEENNHKRIRRLLDYPDDKRTFSEFESTIREKKADDDHEAFVDYLNFFHFIAVLKRNNQIRDREILLLFKYYLELLVDYDFVLTYMAEEGFEELLDMLQRLRILSRKRYELVMRTAPKVYAEKRAGRRKRDGAAVP